MLGIYLGIAIGALGKGGVHGPYPAPTGYRWVFLTEDSIQLTEDGKRLIDLERIAA